MNQVDILLKPSLINKKSYPTDNHTNKDFVNLWEQKLKQKEEQLIQKEKKLKEKENQLAQKEDILIKKELNLNQKMMKYSTILEQIISQKQNKSNIPLQSLNQKDKSHRNNNNINEYQNRVINLLNTIRSNSQQQQQSYLASTLQLIDDKSQELQLL